MHRLVLLLLLWVQPPQDFRWWVETPHQSDGHWKFYTPTQMAEKTGIKQWAKHPFGQWRWEWKGIKETDKTWVLEDAGTREPPRPRRWELIPSYSPLWPGQRLNL